MLEPVQDPTLVIRRKVNRVSRACDFCHKRGVRCKPMPGVDPAVLSNCLTCFEHNVSCTYTRPGRKRGSKARGISPSSSVHTESGGLPIASYVRPSSDTSYSSRYQKIHPATVRALVNIYFDTIYPIFPFFDEGVFMQDYKQQKIPSDSASYAALMAMCALSSAHVADGTVFNQDLVVPAAKAINHQFFIDEAQAFLPKNITDFNRTEYIQCLGLLSLTGTHTSNPHLIHYYLGLYNAVVCHFSLFDESRWDRSFSLAEREIRRRLYWSLYRLEVHSAVIYTHMPRISDTYSAVEYPVPSGLFTRDYTENCSGDNWLTGWNVITDLYRILEHALERFKTSRPPDLSLGIANPYALPYEEVSYADEIQNRVPYEYRTPMPKSANVEQNRKGFQVSNIVCTLRLLKMVCFVADGQSLTKACKVAIDLIDDCEVIPIDYFRAIGSPMFQELSGIGYILSSIAGTSLSIEQYNEIRIVLIKMADFLDKCDIRLISTSQRAGPQFRDL
ncbi:hypothetical protein CANCADRAFT_46071 [Tortispora caseinolytica NRRL Y-17796]|uniref:Zn(2)-C6 fungal-type domain-containing protein n=1 Tax=Tortispora caseinolytica NRRL Y-17796 TaxID=767744 RepID=A0A1E4TD65_9ASCO|nr:hypothetical protein CANCADRAFT_46071 [Tortispora caseinolytica NRRL Y-17796]